ncbi:uncharacterized protein LOC141491988 [Macrotis lagotis]|uniref:uncharacterized protein LOC141491988 n=1 Tax=Macrotis lagotis TaxID=92651 RepID=UPI003D69FB87
MEELSVHNALLNIQTDPTYLPEILQGCSQVPESPSHQNVFPTSSQCPDFQVEVPQCPDQKTQAMAAPLLFPNCQVKATLLSHQSEISPSLEHRDKQAISQLLCSTPQQRTIVTAFPDLDHPQRDRANLSSCSNHQVRTIISSPSTERTRDITVVTNRGLNQSQTRATGRPLRDFKPKIRTRIISSDHDQQARVMTTSSSFLVREATTCSDLLAEISNCPIYKIQSTLPDKTSLNSVQREKIFPSLNYGLKTPPVSKPRTIFSLNCNYFAEVKDIHIQNQKEISSHHQTEILPNNNQRTKVELSSGFHNEIAQWSDNRAQVSSCFDHFYEGSSESSHQITFSSGSDQKIKVPFNHDCQVLPSPVSDLWTESAITIDHQTKVPPDSDHQNNYALDVNHCCEIELDLDDWTKSSLDLNHQVLAAPTHDEAALDLQNNRMQPKSSYQSKIALGLDHCCEMNLDLDSREKYLLNSNCQEVKASPEYNKQAKTTVGTVKKSITQPKFFNQVKAISGLEHYSELNFDLDHREKSILNSNYQVKSSLEHDKKTKPTRDVIQKSTTKMSPEHQVSSISDSDHKKEIAILPNYKDSTQLVPDYQSKTPLGPDYLSEISPKSYPDQTCEFSQVLEKDSNDALGSGKWAVHLTDNLIKLPHVCDQEVKTPTNLHQQSLPQLFPHPYYTKTVSNPLSQDQAKNSGASTWSFGYFKPNTIGCRNISNKNVNKIISSIPKEKIKNDIQKQILLRQIKKHPNSKSGPRLSSSYPVCLICASWVPHGCIHAKKIKEYSEARLLAIPMPMPGSKEEMGIKFVLQVPEKKPSIKYLQTHHYIIPYR